MLYAIDFDILGWALRFLFVVKVHTCLLKLPKAGSAIVLANLSLYLTKFSLSATGWCISVNDIPILFAGIQLLGKQKQIAVSLPLCIIAISSLIHRARSTILSLLWNPNFLLTLLTKKDLNKFYEDRKDIEFDELEGNIRGNEKLISNNRYETAEASRLYHIKLFGKDNVGNILISSDGMGNTLYKYTVKDPRIKPSFIKPEVSEIFKSNPELANQV